MSCPGETQLESSSMSPGGLFGLRTVFSGGLRVSVIGFVPQIRSWLALGFGVILFFTGAARQQSSQIGAIAIVGGTVVDGTGRAPLQADVLLRGGRIAALGQNLDLPEDARVIRAEGQTLLPGLFDLHTHLPNATGAGVSGDSSKHLAAYLYCGVTSVVDYGPDPEALEPMRRLVQSGGIEGPRLHLAVRMTTPGGHGAEGGRGESFTLEVQTPREARDAVRRVLSYGPM